MLFHAVVELVSQAIPNPSPSAPAAFADKVSTAISWAKWASLAIVMAVLSGSGAMLFAESRGAGSGISPELKSKLGAVVVVLIIVGSASQIITFLS
jgi:hypothetical protein